MLKIKRRTFPLEKEGEINRLTSELEAEKAMNNDLEAGIVELAELYAEQDDAIVELAELIGG